MFLDKNHELTDHLGNVRVTFKAGTNTNLEVLSKADYYAFGGQLPGRIWQQSGGEYRFGYQGQEKSMDETNWDNFELRNFNHDLGRWSAPDPYAQFHSPYIGMANNPVNMIDPDGGYIVLSDQGRSQRLKFIQSQEMDRMHGRGRYSFWFLMNNYRNAIQDLYKKHLQQGNPMLTDGKDRGDVAFLKALLRLNNDYVGLGLGCSVLSSGMDFISQNTMVVNKDLVGQLLEQNGTAAKMDDMSRAAAAEDPWVTSTPQERTEMGIKSGVYAKYSLVGVSVSKRQIGGKDSETGETDDFVTGLSFYYESNDGNSFHSYVDLFPSKNDNLNDVKDGGSQSLSSVSFQFEKIAGNWQVAAVSDLKVIANIPHLIGGPETRKIMEFDLEVGLPIILRDKSYVSPMEGAIASANAANLAANYFQTTKVHAYLFTQGVFAKAFAGVMQTFLQFEIPGARVSSYISTPGIKPTPAVFTW